MNNEIITTSTNFKFSKFDYLHGRCHIVSLALSTIHKNAKIYEIYDDKGLLTHYVCYIDGLFYDIRGRLDENLNLIAEEFYTSKFTLKRISFNKLLNKVISNELPKIELFEIEPLIAYCKGKILM